MRVANGKRRQPRASSRGARHRQCSLWDAPAAGRSHGTNPAHGTAVKAPWGCCRRGLRWAGGSRGRAGPFRVQGGGRREGQRSNARAQGLASAGTGLCAAERRSCGRAVTQPGTAAGGSCAGGEGRAGLRDPLHPAGEGAARLGRFRSRPSPGSARSPEREQPRVGPAPRQTRGLAGGLSRGTVPPTRRARRAGEARELSGVLCRSLFCWPQGLGCGYGTGGKKKQHCMGGEPRPALPHRSRGVGSRGDGKAQPHTSSFGSARRAWRGDRESWHANGGDTQAPGWDGDQC